MVRGDTKAALVTGTTLKTAGPVLVDSRLASERHRYAIAYLHVMSINTYYTMKRFYTEHIDPAVTCSVVYTTRCKGILLIGGFESIIRVGIVFLQYDTFDGRLVDPPTASLVLRQPNKKPQKPREQPMCSTPWYRKVLE